MSEVEKSPTGFKILNPEEIEFIKKEIKRYEQVYSCLIPSLFKIQKRLGWISSEVVRDLSQITEIPESHINEVLQFYTMFNKKPVGRLHVQVCCNLSCAMNGARETVKRLCHTFQVEPGQMSPDKMVTVTPVECLGACDKAPMMQINEDYYEDLSVEESVQKVIDLSNQLSETGSKANENKSLKDSQNFQKKSKNFKGGNNGH